jgi:hypothetical protein
MISPADPITGLKIPYYAFRVSGEEIDPAFRWGVHCLPPFLSLFKVLTPFPASGPPAKII